MTEYICEPIRDFEWDSGYECGYIRKGELIRCKDCKWWRSNKKECIEWYDSPYAPADGYCFRAERKEE